MKDAFEEPGLTAVSDAFQARTESVLRDRDAMFWRNAVPTCVSKTLPLRRSHVSHPSHKVPSIFPCGLPPPETGEGTLRSGKTSEEWKEKCPDV